MRRRLSTAMGLVLFLFSSPVLAAPLQDANDVVTSRHVHEADAGTSQDTNSGNGIKTGHITDGAITDAKIAPGAVTDSKISGPISATKIQQGSGSGLDADTVDGMHAAQFAPASHAHIQADITGLDASLAGKADLGHNHDNVYQQKYAKVAVVAESGGDYYDPAAALSDIAAWCGTPSASNPCLVKLMPGVYDIGSQVQIQTRQYVDIEGAGENVTIVRGNVTGPYMPGVLLAFASNSEVRFLAVENVGPGARGSAIGQEYGSAKLAHETARASGKSEWNIGIYILGTPVLTDVTAIAEGGQKSAGVSIGGLGAGPDLRGVSASASAASSYNIGINFQDMDGTATLTNVTATANGGSISTGLMLQGDNNILLIDGSVLLASDGTFSNAAFDAGYGRSTTSVRNSRIQGSIVSSTPGSLSIHNSSIQGEIWNSGALNLALSEVGGAISNTGVLGCFGLYDTSMNPVTCP